MSKGKIKAETDEFVKMLENKKLKQANAYITKIDVEEPDPIAIQIIGSALERCLVRKETTPQGIIYALLFYKELFLRSQFDFMESQEQFNPKIHKFIYDTCLYNPTAPPDERGDNYFKDSMKIPLNDDIRAMGNTLVLLSLELMQCMAKWYPKDYFDDGETRYATYYNELKKRKVTFPTKYTYMKPENEAKFKQNHAKWLKRMEEFEQQIQEQEKKEIQKPSPPNPPQNKSVQPLPAKSISKPSSQIAKISLTKSNFQNNPPAPPPSNKQIPKENKQKAPIPVIVNVPKKEGEPEKKEQKPETSKSIENQAKLVPESKKNQNTQKIKPEEQTAMFILQQKKPLQEQPKQSIQKNRPTSQQKLPPQQPNKSKPIQKPPNPPSKPELSKQEKNKPPQIDSLPSQRQSKGVFILPENPSEKKIEPSVKQQTSSPEKRQPENKSPGKNEKNQQKSHRQGQRIKLPKTQKPNKSMNVDRKPDTPYKNVAQNKINVEEVKKFYRTEKKFIKEEISNPKKSLPKVEKKNLVNDEFYGVEYINQSPTPNKFKNEFKTLSDFRNLKNKRKIGNTQEISYVPTEPILKIIQRSGLGEKTIPFLPEYFEPVNMKMEALILESLRIGSNTTLEPSKAFYKKSKIALRLIKSQGSYLLSIVNLSNEPMNIGYSPGLQAKYGDENGCRIKVKGLERARLEDVSAWRVLPSEFADIPFDFETTDANFKFLQIVLAIDNQIINFLLPITLLDQGVITNALDLAEINSFINLHGRILKSTPIKISSHRHEINLPPFLGRSQNKDSKLLGFMTYSIRLNTNKEITVSILVKQCQYSPDQQQIHAIYDNRIGENEDFAKVLIQLLCFLLANEP